LKNLNPDPEAASLFKSPN